MFYFITGFGALALHLGVQAYEMYSIVGNIAGDGVSVNVSDGHFSSADFPGTNDDFRRYISILYAPTVGASGAIFGLLLAFAMLFPNTELMLIFLPIPIKAKYFIPIMMALELFLGIGNFEWDNIAHFAHLGGALFGFIMVKIWQRNRNNFY